MTVRRLLVAWATDWRNGATLAASVAVAVIAFVLIDASQARNDALDARNRTAAAATRRIDLLNERIENLGEEMAEAAFSNGARIGGLADQVAALQEQVRQLGGEPVIPSTTTTTSSRASTTSAPRTTTTTRPPPPEDEPPPPPDDDRLCLGPICIGGSSWSSYR